MNINNLRQLRTFFARHHFPLNETGTNGKLIHRLLDQIRRDEVILIPHTGGIAQLISIVVVDVRYRITDRVVQHLEETHRQHSNGSTTTCEQRGGISKKIKGGEEPIIAARRCLKDKLGFKKIPPIKSVGLSERPISMNASYPCPFKFVLIFKFSCDLPKKLYDPNGYERKRPDKKRVTHFRWIPRIEPIKK